MNKLNELVNWFADKNKVIIALSGGVDSAVVELDTQEVKHWVGVLRLMGFFGLGDKAMTTITGANKAMLVGGGMMSFLIF